MSGVHRLLTRKDKRSSSKVFHPPSGRPSVVPSLLSLVVGPFEAREFGAATPQTTYGRGHKRQTGSRSSLHDVPTALEGAAASFKRPRKGQR